MIILALHKLTSARASIWQHNFVPGLQVSPAPIAVAVPHHQHNPHLFWEVGKLTVDTIDAVRVQLIVDRWGQCDNDGNVAVEG